MNQARLVNWTPTRKAAKSASPWVSTIPQTATAPVIAKAVKRSGFLSTDRPHLYIHEGPAAVGTGPESAGRISVLTAPLQPNFHTPPILTWQALGIVGRVD